LNENFGVGVSIALHHGLTHGPAPTVVRMKFSLRIGCLIGTLVHLHICTFSPRSKLFLKIFDYIIDL